MTAPTSPPQRPPGFHVVTNEDIYHKVTRLEKQVDRISVIFSAIAFIAAPLVSVLVTQLIGK